MTNPDTELFAGVVAEFVRPDDLLEAAQRVRTLGCRKVEAYTPFPVKGLGEVLTGPSHLIQFLTLVGGVSGGVLAYGLLYYLTVWSYPVNVGGRPLDSWPSFIPITFELTVLGASLAAFFGMLISNGLPRPHHPVFDLPGFDAASRDHFLLWISAYDPRFDDDAIRGALSEAAASRVVALTP